MSYPGTPTPPAGWYADPAGAPVVRWWDGAQWTADVRPWHAAEPETTFVPGTSVYTPWIWVVVLLPLLSAAMLPLIDWDDYITDAMGRGGASMVFTPAYLLVTFLSWVITGATVVAAWLDWRELKRRGVARPFHWAWTFLGSIVYAIGRSVVVRSRTGRGLAPMWVSIAVAVVSVILAVVMVATLIVRIAELGSSFAG